MHDNVDRYNYIQMKQKYVAIFIYAARSHSAKALISLACQLALVESGAYMTCLHVRLRPWRSKGGKPWKKPSPKSSTVSTRHASTLA
jgi:hypothetical protein